MEETEASSPRSPTRAHRLWQKVRATYILVDYHALPEYLRDNEYILKHYRADWPLKQTILSVFSIHNETLNIWTHLVGFLLVLFLTVHVALKIPQVVDLHNVGGYLPSFPDWHLPGMLSNCLPEMLSSGNRTTEQCVLRTMKDALFVQKPTTRWPFFIFMGGAMFCLFSSSVCHLLSCHSERMSYFLLRLDYTGIAALIAASFYPPVYYSFMCDPLMRNIYLITITLLGLAAILVSLLPVFQTPRYRPIRAALFVGMGASGTVPILHKLLLHSDQEIVRLTTAYEVAMGLLYGIGALVYVTRVPERWKPGRFDIAGHSHQLFHVLVVAAVYTHYRAGLLYLNWRDVTGCSVP